MTSTRPYEKKSAQKNFWLKEAQASGNAVRLSDQEGD